MAAGPFVPHPREAGHKEVWAAVPPPPHSTGRLEELPAVIYSTLKPFHLALYRHTLPQDSVLWLNALWRLSSMKDGCVLRLPTVPVCTTPWANTFH